MKRKVLVAAGILAAASVVACQKKNQPAEPPKAEAPAAPAPGAPGMPPPEGGMPGMGGQPGTPAAPREVVVPPEVQKAWKAVVLQITDKGTNKSEDVKIEIGKSAKFGSLDIAVESFLPAFTMAGGSITSKSNNTENPAARVTVKEGGNQIFQGWLFSMYPDTHPMTHDKYKLVLKDFVKA